jgi:hypothetical protein
MRVHRERFVILLTMLWIAAAPAFAASEPMAPVANPKAVVVSGQARFTVLAPGMIRLEWGASE